MSVLVVGKTPSGNFLVTDAIITTYDDSEYTRDCRIDDKITALYSNGGLKWSQLVGQVL